MLAHCKVGGVRGLLAEVNKKVFSLSTFPAKVNFPKILWLYKHLLIKEIITS